MNAADVIRIKSWNAQESIPSTAALSQQQNAEETLCEYVPSHVMQAVHLLLCLQILNDRECLLSLTPYEKDMRRKVIAGLGKALEDLEPLSAQREQLDKMIDQHSAELAGVRKAGKP